MSNAFHGQKASWAFVSVLHFLLSVASLIRRSKCTGETPDGKDFDAFVGAEKAQEIRSLFSNWIHKIYCKLSSTVL